MMHALSGTLDTQASMAKASLSDAYFRVRFPFDPRRDTVWREVCKYLQRRYIPAGGRILDLGAAYCSFINNIEAREKHALDISGIVTEYAQPEVVTHVQTCTRLDDFEAASLDVVFASNLFEHLSRDDVRDTLEEIMRVLTPRGKLIVLQPNFRYCPKTYFDDYTHTAIFTHRSLPDLFETHGFAIEDVVPRLLPVNMKSSLRLCLPRLDLIVRTYLRLPIRPFAGQMLVVARKPDSAVAPLRNAFPVPRARDAGQDHV